MYLLAGIIAGSLLSMQTAANAKLRSYVKSPLTSAFLSCIVSFVVIILLLLSQIAGGNLRPFSTAGTSWWMYLGGCLGIVILTGSIVLFPILGAVQTTVLPIFGQILLGILADTFGWFGGLKKAFTLQELIGLLILIAGIVCVVILPERGNKEKDDGRPRQKRIWLFRIAGVVVGMASASQAAINGKLGSVVGSALYAASISITTVVILSLVINIQQGTLKNISSIAGKKSALWIIPGGVFGAALIILNTVVSPVIGTGNLMTLSVAGQLLFSILIQNFGWFCSPRKRIKVIQVAGVILMFVGVMFVEII